MSNLYHRDPTSIEDFLNASTFSKKNMAMKERKPPENNKAIEKTLRKHKNC